MTGFLLFFFSVVLLFWFLFCVSEGIFKVRSGGDASAGTLVSYSPNHGCISKSFDVRGKQVTAG